jgi:hypothetical protein
MGDLSNVNHLTFISHHRSFDVRCSMVNVRSIAIAINLNGSGRSLIDRPF